MELWEAPIIVVGIVLPFWFVRFASIWSGTEEWKYLVEFFFNVRSVSSSGMRVIFTYFIYLFIIIFLIIIIVIFITTFIQISIVLSLRMSILMPWAILNPCANPCRMSWKQSLSATPTWATARWVLPLVQGSWNNWHLHVHDVFICNKITFFSVKLSFGFVNRPLK